MMGNCPDNLYIIPWPESNIRGLNRIIELSWEEAIHVARSRYINTRGVSKRPGATRRKVSTILYYVQH